MVEMFEIKRHQFTSFQFNVNLELELASQSSIGNEKEEHSSSVRIGILCTNFESDDLRVPELIPN